MKTTDIDALARLLDEDPTAAGEVPAEVAHLATLAQAMEARATAPRPAFRESLRATLLAEAARPVPPTPLQRVRAAVDEQIARVRYSARAAAATGVAAMTLSTGGVAAAATLSVPGDLFYPVKLAVEDARLDRADGSVTRSEMLLSFVSSRLSEAERAVVADRHDSAAEALVAADAALREAAGDLIREYQSTGDRDVLRGLEDFGAASRSRLDSLRQAAQGPAMVALADLEVAFDRIDQRIAAVTGDCCPVTPGGAGPGTPQPGQGFDFAHIPPAGESFEACPCPAASPQEPRPATAEDEATEAPAADATAPPADEVPAPPDGETQQPPASPEQPGDDEPQLPLPEEIDDTLDEVVDPVEDIIDDVIDPLPVPDPPTPLPDPLAPLLDPLAPRDSEGPLPLPRL